MFFSEGGADIREVQAYRDPEAEQYLDWFHITTRITVLGPYAKGLDTGPEKRESVGKILDSTKHSLWHGNVVRAGEQMEELHGYLENEKIEGDHGRKRRKALEVFDTYLTANRNLIPNWGERWRNEEATATGFVESAVNQMVRKRFDKRHSRCNGRKGARTCYSKRGPGCSITGLRRPFRSGVQDSTAPRLEPRRRPPERPNFMLFIPRIKN
jgi:hypothetical protein